MFSPWVIWGCAALFYLYEFVLRVSPSVMTEGLMRDFSVNAPSLGLLTSFYYYSYTLLQVPCGMIVDALGTRFVVTASSALCALGAVLFAGCQELWVAQIARFIIGAGSACAFISCLKAATSWFPENRFAFLSGLTSMMGTLGGLCAGYPLALLVNAFGWRQAMVILGGVGILVTALCWILIKDKAAPMKEEKSNFFEGIVHVAKLPQNWLVGLYGCLFYLPISVVAELWGVPYFMKIYNLTNAHASLMSNMLFIGMAFGGVWVASLSNSLKSRKKAMMATILSATLLFITIVLIPLPLPLMVILLLLAGLCCGGEVLSFTCAKELNPLSVTATAMGFTNMLISVGGIVFQPLLGFVLHFVWDGAVDSAGVPLYSAACYQMAMLVIPVALAFSFVCCLFIKETFKRN